MKYRLYLIHHTVKTDRCLKSQILEVLLEDPLNGPISNHLVATLYKDRINESEPFLSKDYVVCNEFKTQVDNRRKTNSSKFK